MTISKINRHLDRYSTHLDYFLDGKYTVSDNYSVVGWFTDKKHAELFDIIYRQNNNGGTMYFLYTEIEGIINYVSDVTGNSILYSTNKEDAVLFGNKTDALKIFFDNETESLKIGDAHYNFVFRYAIEGKENI